LAYRIADNPQFLDNAYVYAHQLSNIVSNVDPHTSEKAIHHESHCLTDPSPDGRRTSTDLRTNESHALSHDPVSYHPISYDPISHYSIANIDDCSAHNSDTDSITDRVACSIADIVTYGIAYDFANSRSYRVQW
jgi:hypothetical protein